MFCRKLRDIVICGIKERWDKKNRCHSGISNYIVANLKQWSNTAGDPVLIITFLFIQTSTLSKRGEKCCEKIFESHARVSEDIVFHYFEAIFGSGYELVLIPMSKYNMHESSTIPVCIFSFYRVPKLGKLLNRCREKSHITNRVY